MREKSKGWAADCLAGADRGAGLNFKLGKKAREGKDCQAEVRINKGMCRIPEKAKTPLTGATLLHAHAHHAWQCWWMARRGRACASSP